MNTLRTGCKINVFLRVLRRREDGYHDIESLFLPLNEPHDEVQVAPSATATPGTVRCAFFSPNAKNTSLLPLEAIDPKKNTLTRACALFAEASGFAPALDIRVIKGVPQGAGLGGGSANAAALLRHLQDLAKKAGVRPLSAEALLSLAVRVGADVPFFLFGSPALVSGIGERLVACAPPFPGRYLVLVCPKESISTAWAFNTLDERRAALSSPAKKEEKRDAAEDMQKKIHEILTSGLPRASKALADAQGFKNDFEELVFAAFPSLSRLYGTLCGSGAELVRMSGTGSSLFALYKEKSTAERTAKMLAKKYASVYTQRLPAG